MAAKAARAAFALSALPADLHLALGVAPPGPLAPEAHVWIAAERGRRQHSEALRRSAVDGRPARADGRAAHLDARHALPPACPLPGQRRRLVARWTKVGARPKPQVPRSGTRAFHHLPGQNLRRDPG